MMNPHNPPAPGGSIKPEPDLRLPDDGRPGRKKRRILPSIFFLLTLSAAICTVPTEGIAQDDSGLTDYRAGDSGENDTLVLDLDGALALARENNLVLKNAELELERARAGKQSVVDLDPVEFRYTYGQINTGLDDRFVELEQDFGSILTHVQRSGYVKQQIETMQSNLLLTRAELERRVKALYHYWLYQYSLMDLTKKEYYFYSRLVDIAGSQYANGETSLLEKSLVETRFAGVKNKLMESERMFQETGILLQQVLQVSCRILPGDSLLTRIPGGMDPGVKENYLINQYYDKLYRLELANVKLEKSRFFPGLSAQYFNQTIDRVAGFSGFQVGMSFPLWFLPQEGRVKQARIQSEIARNEMQVQLQNRDRSVVNLKGKLRSYGEQLDYYEKTALESSGTLIRTARLQLERQGIEYFEFIGSISVALDIQREYLNQLNQYNQCAIELEYLTQ